MRTLNQHIIYYCLEDNKEKNILLSTDKEAVAATAEKLGLTGYLFKELKGIFAAYTKQEMFKYTAFINGVYATAWANNKKTAAICLGVSAKFVVRMN